MDLIGKIMASEYKTLRTNNITSLQSHGKILISQVNEVYRKLKISKQILLAIVQSDYTIESIEFALSSNKISSKFDIIILKYISGYR